MSEGRIWVMVWVAFGVFPLAAMLTGSPSTVHGAPAMITTDLSGQQLYTLACASCHGVGGHGRVFTKEGQKIEVPDITYGELSKMYTKNFDSQARAAIVQGLDEEGKPLNPIMPRWTMLSPKDVGKIIAYIKTLK